MFSSYQKILLKISILVYQDLLQQQPFFSEDEKGRRLSEQASATAKNLLDECLKRELHTDKLSQKEYFDTLLAFSLKIWKIANRAIPIRQIVDEAENIIKLGIVTREKSSEAH